MLISRRQFLKSSAAVGIGTALLPSVLQKAAAAAGLEAAGGIGPRDRRTLIVVEMAGGNDVLNTLVPYADGRYFDLRGRLSVPPGDVIPLDRDVGLHPSLAAFKPLWDAGRLAIVEGVGYPNPTFSHFKARDIWRSGGPEADLRAGGWLGRYLEQSQDAAESGFRGLAIGRRLPEELLSSVPIPIVHSAERYRVRAESLSPDLAQARTRSLLDLYKSYPRSTPFAALFDATLAAAVESSQAVRGVNDAYSPALEYPDTPFARGLQLMAAAIDGGLGVRVGHVTLNGFDTHATQDRDHPRLLRTLSEGLAAFYEDLKAHGRDGDVVIMTWSEFGRRAKSNASSGTDHGGAGLVFLLGTAVKGGFYGERPSLRNLERDNLVYTTDFRSVYATVLEEWLGAPADIVVGKGFKTLPIIAA